MGRYIHRIAREISGAEPKYQAGTRVVRNCFELSTTSTVDGPSKHRLRGTIRGLSKRSNNAFYFRFVDSHDEFQRISAPIVIMSEKTS